MVQAYPSIINSALQSSISAMSYPCKKANFLAPPLPDFNLAMLELLLCKSIVCLFVFIDPPKFPLLMVGETLDWFTKK